MARALGCVNSLLRLRGVLTQHRTNFFDYHCSYICNFPMRKGTLVHKQRQREHIGRTNDCGFDFITLKTRDICKWKSDEESPFFRFVTACILGSFSTRSGLFYLRANIKSKCVSDDGLFCDFAMLWQNFMGFLESCVFSLAFESTTSHYLLCTLIFFEGKEAK